LTSSLVAANTRKRSSTTRKSLPNCTIKSTAGRFRSSLPMRAGTPPARVETSSASPRRSTRADTRSSPSPLQSPARHYLWRFWERLPKEGHIVIFDRTWYGRVMVERLEGFCTESDWKRAYTEINEFEQQLTDWGAVVLKFWVQIDKDTQLKRFEDRQNDPDKQWKITEEDWRNREKWDSYEQAIDEMLQKTSTQYAPWHIIESNCKYYARIKALELLTDALEAAIDKAQKQNKK